MSGIISQIGARSKIVSGNVGIGTAAPGAPLSVYVDSSTTDTPTLKIEQDGAGDASTVYTLTGLTNWATGIDHTDDKFKISNSTDLINVCVFAAESSGDITFTGDLIMADGKGIDFSAYTDGSVAGSTTSQTLKDYEEGTWTAALATDGGSITVTPGTNTGFYTKVGNLCTIQGNFTISTITAPTGDVWFSGLPFSSASHEGVEGAANSAGTYAGNRLATAETGYVVLQQGPGSPLVYIRTQGNTDDGNEFAPHLDTGSNMNICMTYRTA